MTSPATTRTPELTNVVLEVLGDLAFMVTDDRPAESPAGADWMQGEISYHGDARGTVRCWCTRGLAVRLAANLLGIEAEEGQAHLAAEDALREFMNVLCGQLVTAWHGRAGVFNLSIPRVSVGDGPPAQLGGAARDTCQVSVEGERLVCIGARDQ